VRDVVCLLSYGFFPCTGDGLLQRTIYPLFSRLFCGERLRVATSLQPLSNVQLQGPRSKVCWIFHSRISGLRFRSTVVTCGCACALRGARAFLPYRGPKRIRTRTRMLQNICITRFSVARVYSLAPSGSTEAWLRASRWRRYSSSTPRWQPGIGRLLARSASEARGSATSRVLSKLSSA